MGLRILGAGLSLNASVADPDPGDPKKTGSESGSGSYLDMFLMFSKIKKFVWHFLNKFKHIMTLKIKDKKLLLRNCI